VYGKRQLLALVIFAGLTNAAAQNLIVNPGFQNDFTSWSALWTRDSGVGTAQIVTSPVHSGSKACHIHHWGLQDWSLEPQAVVAVKPGQLYEYSAWVRVDSLAAGGVVQISVVLRDTRDSVLDWSYATASCTLSIGNYCLYKSQLLTSAGIASVQPRIIGVNACNAYADDFSFSLVDSVPSRFSHPYTLENSSIKATINPVSFGFTLQSKASGKSYLTDDAPLFQTTSIDSFADSLVFHCLYLQDDFPMDIAVSLTGNALKIALRADSARALSGDFTFPGAIASNTGDYLLIPKGTGIICPAVGAPAYMNKYYWIEFSEWQTDLCFTGVTDLTKGYMITTDDPWFTRLEFSGTSGSSALAPHLVHEASKHVYAKNRTVYYTIVDTGGYVSMCSWYRAHAQQSGYVKTFAQKEALVPAIDRLRGAVDFWIQGTGMWYSNAGFFRDLIDYGLDKALFSSGVSDLVVDTLNTLGFLTSVYDCYCDAYPPGNPGYVSDGYATDAIVQEDGTYLNGWLAYLANNQTLQAREVCATSHARYAMARVSAERQTKNLNCRFIDVEQAIGLQDCWSAVHPVNHFTDAMCRKKLFDTLRTSFSLVLGGEQARDFVFPFVDYGEGTMSFSPVTHAGYDWSTPELPDSNFINYDINPAIHVPLHGLIYHDVHVPTWYTGDGLSKVPAYWDEKDLFNILYSSMPLFMPPDTGYWKSNFERFMTSYNLVSAVTRSVGFAAMTGHRFLSPDKKVQQTTFTNGWTATVNFDSVNSYSLGTISIAPRGFYATDGAREVYRIVNGSGTTAAARLDDRLFINGYGTANAVHGVMSSGAVLLRKDSSWVHLAFIGSQNYVDLNPAQIPWPLTGMRVFTKDSSKEITPVAQPNGFLRINRVAGTDFYRILGTFTNIKQETQRFRPMSLTIARHAHTVSITYFISAVDGAKVDLLDCKGRTIRTFVDPDRKTGTHRLDLVCPIDGIVIIKVQTGAVVIVKKVLMY